MSVSSIPAVQRTKAIWALTIIGAILEVYEDCATGTDAFARQLRKVRRWHGECAETVKQGADGNLSAGARRDLDGRFAVVGPYMETGDMTPSARAERYAALWWTALTELLSARTVCPLYCASRAWLRLEQTVTTVCVRLLLPAWPGCDEAGTKISLEVD